MSGNHAGATSSGRLAAFTAAVERAVDRNEGEAALLADVQDAMRTLVAADDWLAPEFAVPHPQYYQQYLLHLDPGRRFSVVSFVWGPGQETPVHDHCIWGVIGMLRGAEVSQAYRRAEGCLLPDAAPELLKRGEVAAVSPAIGDIHRVSNAVADRASISIHVYGTDIGRQKRHVFDPQTGASKEFISGYATPQRAAA